MKSLRYKIKSALVVGLISILYTGASMAAIEGPAFTLIEKSGAFELREYEPKIIAEVEVSGTMKQASNKGFKMIAGYIFGGNTSQQGAAEKISMTAPVTMKTGVSEKISMTAPVTMQQSDSQWRMNFVMPSKYTMETLPTPNNAAVTLREIPKQKYAVIRFSGLARAPKVAYMTTTLENWLKTKNITPTGKPELSRYDPPWTLPLFRRNEVMIAY
ncbi:SOUL family heme-binding protein [Leucothrix arctica]|uniref:Heme-binding protein n=1 Tax=Leucothrix arctica TaxID=1481894 RepID=A0A317CAG0_9GAMM|nr:heme-binding protein [Leucothrix arctica]PWQ93370.1 heme-binding protein [Leucothrix arctica]